MPRFRLRLWMIMALVAVVGSLLGGGIVVWRGVERSMSDFYGPGGTLERQGIPTSRPGH